MLHFGKKNVAVVSSPFPSRNYSFWKSLAYTQFIAIIRKNKHPILPLIKRIFTLAVIQQRVNDAIINEVWHVAFDKRELVDLKVRSYYAAIALRCRTAP